MKHSIKEAVRQAAADAKRLKAERFQRRAVKYLKARCGLDDAMAGQVVLAIRKGEIPHIKFEE